MKTSADLAAAGTIPPAVSMANPHEAAIVADRTGDAQRAGGAPVGPPG